MFWQCQILLERVMNIANECTSRNATYVRLGTGCMLI